MDGTDELERLTRDILERHCGPETVEAAEGSWAPELWSALAASGLTALGLPEEDGGSGGGLAEATAVVRVAAGFAAPLPLVPALLLAPRIRAAFGLRQADGLVTVSLTPLDAERADGGWRITGRLHDVRYGHLAESLLIVARHGEELIVAELENDGLDWERATDLAGEPRDSAEVDVVVRRTAPIEGATLDELRDLEALGTAWAMVGAMERVLGLVVGYTTQREQFGRTLSRFQAVKQLAAEIAGEVAISRAAAVAATSSPSPLAVASARVRAAMAATPVARIALQLHGAIGYTREYPLHQLTRRLWSWRDEGGGERGWTELAGRRALAGGPERLWQTLTAAGASESGEESR